MLALGRSKPWKDLLLAITDEMHMDAAVLDYFTPLKKRWNEQRLKVGASPSW